MASYKILLDNDVRHLESDFPAKTVRQLGDIGLSTSASDDDIIVAASERGHIIVTNNRKDYEGKVKERIAASSKKELGCTQVHGLVIVVPSDALKQTQALKKASRQLWFEGRRIGWKEVNKLCLKVVIHDDGTADVSKLPRCPHCTFADEKDDD